MSPANAVTATSVSDDPQAYENKHVHSVYEEIAPHFSSTRYKPWPVIAQFLASIPRGWVGLDSGTGNGKYLPLPYEQPGSIWTIGLDRSRSLLEFAKTTGGTTREVVWGDVLDKPWRDGAFDYAISIATIHHLSTYARRKLAVQRLIQCISPSHGRALIYVWAIEQDERSKRSIPTASSHNGGQLQESAVRKGQDVFVPWVLSPSAKKPQERTGLQIPLEAVAVPQVFNRYYHMFARGELSQLAHEAASDLGICVGSPRSGDGTGIIINNSGIEIVQDGWEGSNYYVELRRWQC